MKKLFILCYLLCNALLIHAQGYTPYIQNFGPRDYGKTQPSENYAVLQDQQGYLYFGNAGGVLQYDGKKWNFIPVKTGHFVSALSIDKNGRIFVGSFGEFGYLNLEKNGTLHYKSLVPLLNQKDQDIGLVMRVHSTSTATYFQLEDKIIEYKNNECVLIGSENTFHLSFLVEDRIFARERYVGLIEIEKGKKILLSDDTLFSEYGIFSILPYKTNELLIVTQEKGLFIFNTGNKSLISFGQDSTLLRNIRFYGGVELNSHAYALNSLDNGIIIVDRFGKITRTINKKGGLASDEVTQVQLDRQKNLWAATPSGISFINTNSPFEYFKSTNGLEGSVECVGFSGDFIYVGTNEGIFEMHKANNFFIKRKDLNAHVYSITPQSKNDPSKLIVATSGGMYSLYQEQIQLLKKGNYHLSAELSNDFSLWIGINGLTIIRKSDGFIIHKTDLSISRALGVEIDTVRKEAWIGTLSMGMIRAKFNSNYSEITDWDIYDDLDGLDIEFCRPVKIDNEIKFISSGGFNLFVYEEEVAKSLPDSLKGKPEFERGYFDVYHYKGKEFNKEVSAFLQTKDDFSIACIYTKIHAFIWDEEFTKEFNTIDLGRINGLFHNGNEIYICGDEGMIRFQSDLILENNLHKSEWNNFSAIIKKISAKNGELLYGGHPLSSEELLSLPYKENTLEFEFAFPYYESHHQPEFSWYLEGHDEQWSNWTFESKARFTNLHEGTYTLRVRARTIDGIESKEAVYSFEISSPWYRTSVAYILYAVIFIILIWLAIKISSYNLKQKNARLESIVQERTHEIAQKNKELESSNEQILHQKNEITDSITYAKRIQEAILPINKEIKKCFPKSFILFKPKDIVSGDFYWFHHTPAADVLICADCTGHGVPGAFMSMICTDKLNHTVLEKKIINPGGLLSEVNIGIKRSLKQENEEGTQTKDGMDAAVISYQASNKTLTYAGANRALWLVRNGEITEYKPTKSAVGGFTPEDQIYEELIISVQSGDRFYMSTDGYADQFGGHKGKKMMVKSFKELILQIQNHSINEQEQLLDKAFEDWKNHPDPLGGTFEQVDDVCVIGIEF